MITLTAVNRTGSFMRDLPSEVMNSSGTSIAINPRVTMQCFI